MDERVLAALRRQLERRRRLLDAGARHVGWKVGADIEEIGFAVFGHLTSATVVDGVHAVAGARELRAETEPLIEVGEGGLRYGVALELVDTARPPHAMAAIVERNVFHRAVALGDERVAAWGPEARLWVDGELREAAPVDTDAEAIVARLREQLAAAGEALRPGDVVIAGSVTHVPVGAGGRVVAEIDGAGRAEVALV